MTAFKENIIPAKRNWLISVMALAALACNTKLCQANKSAPVTISPVIQDALSPLKPGQIKLEGFLGDKINLCIHNRITAQSIAELVEPFQQRNEVELWRCEFWGKWFTSAVAAYRYNHDPNSGAIVDKALKDLLATQTSDGYIGTYKDSAHLKGWDIWGRKYVLLGLLAYYDLTADSEVLVAACRHADHLLSEVGPGKANIVKLGRWQGMAASGVLEPTVLLYR